MEYIYLSTFYVNGMIEYNSYNTQDSNTLYEAAKDEYKEFKECITNHDYYGILDEFFDVIHSILKYLLVTYMFKQRNNRIILYIMYFMSGSTGRKHGERYRAHNCIRSHKNHIEHKCAYKKK